jgi:hypothetical protein
MKKDKMLEIVEALIEKRKIKSFSNNDLKGWTAFQFEKSKDRVASTPISSGKIENGLVATHILVKPRPYPKEIAELIEDQSIPIGVKRILMKIYSLRYVDDIIFVSSGNPIKVILTGDRDSIQNNILIPTFGDEFYVIENKKMQITSDLLLWLMFKIKSRNNGILGNMTITMIDDYGASARQRAGNLDCEIENVEKNPLAQISAGVGNDSKKIKMTISYNNREYTFYLYQGMGIFQPVWSAFTAVENEDYNPVREKIGDLQIMALEIIPNIVQEFDKDERWEQEKDTILSEELSDAKSRLP